MVDFVAITLNFGEFGKNLQQVQTRRASGKDEIENKFFKALSIALASFSSVARKVAICCDSISEFTGLKGQIDASAATLMGFLGKRFLRKKEGSRLILSELELLPLQTSRSN